MTRFTHLPIHSFESSPDFACSQYHQTIVSDSGHVWSATPLGLVRYDGVRTLIFGKKQGLKCHGLRTVNAFGSDHLLIGSDLGLELVDITRSKPVSDQFFKLGTIDALDVSQESCLIGTPQGLFEGLPDSGFNRVPHPALSRSVIKAVHYDSSGRAWAIGPGVGLWVRQNHEWEQVPDSLLKGIGSPTCIRSFEGRLFIGGSKGVMILSPELKAGPVLKTDDVVRALYWSERKLWVGTDSGLVRAIVSATELKAHDRSMAGMNIRSFAPDQFDNVWISTNNFGLLRVSALRHSIEYLNDNKVGAVFCFAHTPDGLLIGGEEGLAREDGTWVLEKRRVWDVCQDKGENIWAAAENGLWYVPKNATPEHIRAGDMFDASGRCLCLVGNTLFYGSLKGLLRLGPNGPEEIKTPTGDSFGYVYSLLSDQTGRLWIATLGGGLWSLAPDGTLTSITSGPLHSTSNVYAMTLLPGGDIYVAHDGYISRVSGEEASLVVYTGQSVAAWCLGRHHDGSILAGTSEGLLIYSPEGELISSISDSSQNGRWEFICSRSMNYTENGEILCGLSTGLATINLDKVFASPHRPKAGLTHVRWQKADPRLDGNSYHLPTGKWRMNVNLHTLWYIQEDETRMRYQLEGFDTEWSTLQPVGIITYTSLPKGRYALRVQLSNPIYGMGEAQKLFDIEVSA